MSWLLRLRLDTHLLEAATSALWDHGTTGVVEEPSERTEATKGDERVRLVAGFDSRDAAEAAGGVLARSYQASVEAIESYSWTGNTETHTVHVPSNELGDDATVNIVAGSLFGHGGHPTTVLALKLLVEKVEAGVSVLDVGTGTGVLAIAAARLGANPIWALDIDPAVTETVAANAAANGVAPGTIHTGVSSAKNFGSLTQGAKPGIIVANVLLPVHRELAPLLASSNLDGTLVITSGTLRDDKDELMEIYASAGLSDGSSEVRELDGWIGCRWRIDHG